jgi:Ca2+-binding RTX toxin-like protein
MTINQFGEFTYIQGEGKIVAETSGVYDLKSKNNDSPYDLEFAPEINLSATDSIGTTLVGNDADYETLEASPFGSGTLIAGNGQHDVLMAGSGDDVLTGGIGDDTFYIGTGDDRVTGGSGDDTFIFMGSDGDYNIDSTFASVIGSVSPGTKIIDKQWLNTIESDISDISNISITGVHTLELGDNVLTINLSQLQ